MGGIFLNSWRGAAAEADAAAVEADAAAVEAVAIGEQQTKRTTSGGRVEADAMAGSSSRSGRNREAVGNREQHAAEADASGEQQLKQMQAGSSALQQQLKQIDAIARGAAAEADAIGEQQLCYPAPDYLRRRTRGK